MATDFIPDGCTWFVQEWRGIYIRPCCDQHDWDFYSGNGLFDFVNANLSFAQCLWSLGVYELVIPAFLAVSTIGVVFYVFGKKKTLDKDP